MNRHTSPVARAGAALLAGLCLTAGVTLAAGEGTQSDPLVTLSYLTQTAAPSILDQVDQQTAQYQQELEQRLESAIQSYTAQMDAALGSSGGAQSAATYTVVTLSSGQQLDMEVGCEVMLRIGTAVCVSPSSPGLIDTTTGSALNDGGALVTNHLYMATIADRSVRATAGTVKVLVRGSYTLV